MESLVMQATEQKDDNGGHGRQRDEVGPEQAVPIVRFIPDNLPFLPGREDQSPGAVVEFSYLLLAYHTTKIQLKEESRKRKYKK